MRAAAAPLLVAPRLANCACLGMDVVRAGSGQLCIVAIQVLIKMHLIGGTQRGSVKDEDRYARGEIHADIVAPGLYGLLDTLRRSSSIIAQGPDRERSRVCDA